MNVYGEEEYCLLFFICKQKKDVDFLGVTFALKAVDAKCDSHLLSFAFGVFSLFLNIFDIRCRSPPLINLKKNSN